jgi:hypothetical protein
MLIKYTYSCVVFIYATVVINSHGSAGGAGGQLAALLDEFLDFGSYISRCSFIAVHFPNHGNIYFSLIIYLVFI